MIMEVFKKTGTDEVAFVYLAKNKEGKIIEFTESKLPQRSIEEKWILTISSLFGCPVSCPMCDAGTWYKGKLSMEEILFQIDYMISKRYPNKKVPCRKFKIQFARMGDPALNDAVLEVLRNLPNLYDAPGLIPSVSTVAPANCDQFFDKLLQIKNELYNNGNFQMQFSIHTTDILYRDVCVPIKKWSFKEIATYGEKFFNSKDRKIVLNFPLSQKGVIDREVLKRYFNPEIFIIKLTPINPTISVAKNHIINAVTKDTYSKIYGLIQELKDYRYETLLSIGALEENEIASNCGFAIQAQTKAEFLKSTT
jgi:23S rRNA (adenine2503-C2)-methyltransferase